MDYNSTSVPSGIYNSIPSNPTTTSLDMGSLLIMLGIILLVSIFYIVVNWRLFTKAGRPGWASLIPIYNTYVGLKVAGKPGWWLLLFCIPLLNILFVLLYSLGMAKSFGKGPLFGIFGLFIFSLVGYPILAFGDAKYLGPGGQLLSGGPSEDNEPPQMPTTPPGMQSPTQTPAPAVKPPVQAPPVDAMTPPATPSPGSVVYPPGQTPPPPAPPTL